MMFRYFFVLYLGATCALAQEPTFDRIFQSNMIFQREDSIRIWGKAAPSTSFKVAFDKEAKVVKSTTAGNWEVAFAPRTASFNPMTVRAGKTKIENVLIGDVFLCSGQSNMGFRLNQIAGIRIDTIKRNNALRLGNWQTQWLGREKMGSDELSRCTVENFFDPIWQVSDSSSAARFGAVAWLMGNKLAKELGVPIGLQMVSYGGTAANNWIPMEVLKSDPYFSAYLEGNWFTNRMVNPNHIRGAKKAFGYADTVVYLVGAMPHRWLNEPAFMYDSGIAPLKNLAFKGVLWYQGEADAFTYENAIQYQELFPRLIGAWRTQFQDSELPFFIIQLPAFESRYWPILRESQRLISEKISNTYLVPTIDTGMKRDIHPTDKVPVGNRVADLVLDKVYQKSAVLIPQVGLLEVKAGLITMEIRNVDFSTQKMGETTFFEVGDQYGRYVPAQIRVVDKTHIQLMSTIPNPTYVRYAHVPYPEDREALVKSPSGWPLVPFVLKVN